ncbi:hypothetical protein [Cryobacterium sandaracinum]|uniref:hypothetical protein n=1 Tax=Cryobacterium sandaracinum TaxID=1259247 RepID=UPI003B972024
MEPLGGVRLLDSSAPRWLNMSDTEFEGTYSSVPRVNGSLLQRRLCRGLSDTLDCVPTDSQLRKKPLVLHLGLPLPSRLRFYIYGATQHATERQVGTFKVQLTRGLDTSPPSKRMSFDRSGNIRPILIGYASDLDVFILWDADLHDAGEGFSYSKNVQAPPELVWSALTRGQAEGHRRLRSSGVDERIVACRPNHLIRALKRRIELSNATLLGQP